MGKTTRDDYNKKLDEIIERAKAQNRLLNRFLKDIKSEKPVVTKKVKNNN